MSVCDQCFQRPSKHHAVCLWSSKICHFSKKVANFCDRVNRLPLHKPSPSKMLKVVRLNFISHIQHAKIVKVVLKSMPQCTRLCHKVQSTMDCMNIFKNNLKLAPKPEILSPAKVCYHSHSTICVTQVSFITSLLATSQPCRQYQSEVVKKEEKERKKEKKNQL